MEKTIAMIYPREHSTKASDRLLAPATISEFNNQHLQTPQVWDNCNQETRQKLQNFYKQAYLYAKAAQLFLSQLLNLSLEQRIAIWNGREQHCNSTSWCRYSPVPAYWFGSYSQRRIHFILRTFTRVLQRFELGYRFEEKYRPVRFRCLTNKVDRCRTGVIANASQYGTVRVCPRLLRKNTSVGGMVVLHEMLHQGLGVGDRRDIVCRRSNESRCYRRGARHLVAHQKLEKALRNNDNYAFFARAIYFHMFLNRD